MRLVSDVHGATEKLRRAAPGPGPLLVLGDLINFIDYRTNEGIVADAIGPEPVARMVARRLGLGVPLEQRDPTLLVDVTVILGADWADEDRVPSGAEEIGQGALWWRRAKRAAQRLWPGEFC